MMEKIKSLTEFYIPLKILRITKKNTPKNPQTFIFTQCIKFTDYDSQGLYDCPTKIQTFSLWANL